METLEKYYKITAQQEYEKNPKLSHADVQELLKWSDENLNLNGKLIGKCNKNITKKILPLITYYVGVVRLGFII